MARLYAGSKILSLIYVNSQQFLCAVRLVVRTVDFQSINIGSTPVRRALFFNSAPYGVDTALAVL